VTWDLRRDLAHVYWIGGSPCAGKSTIAERLCAQYALRPYHWDDAFAQLRGRLNRRDHPTLYRLYQMTWHEIWMRPADELLAEAIDAYREQFDMAVDDLLALPRSPPILAEGTAMLPASIHALLPIATSGRAA
jgi:hypothetical protein